MSEPLSPRNSEVARLRALARERSARYEAGRFVVEGPKLVAEVLASDLIVFEVYADADWHMPAEFRQLLRDHDVDLTAVSRRGIERIASTNSPQPVVAEVKMPRADWSELSGATALLVAVDINDPGNVGTLARSALAAGFDGLVALGDTADVFGPKTVRASAGALFRLPVLHERDVQSGLTQISDLGLRRLGTRMNDATACDQADLSRSVALVLGSEAHGLSDAYSPHIDAWLSVPMSGDVESLNVAMAGTILSYEVARQRRF